MIAYINNTHPEKITKFKESSLIFPEVMGQKCDTSPLYLLFAYFIPKLILPSIIF